MSHNLAIFNGLDLRCRNIDRNEARAQISGKRPQPDKIGFKLMQAHIHRHIEHGEGLVTNNSGFRKAMPRLKMLDAGLDIRIEHRT